MIDLGGNGLRSSRETRRIARDPRERGRLERESEVHHLHGIPAARRRLREGDIIGLDLGAIVEGYYADAAVTMPVGEVTESWTRPNGMTIDTRRWSPARGGPAARLPAHVLGRPACP